MLEGGSEPIDALFETRCGDPFVDQFALRGARQKLEILEFVFCLRKCLENRLALVVELLEHKFPFAQKIEQA